MFKGHHWITTLKADAETPARFWTYRLLTNKEFASLPDKDKKAYRLITEADLPILESQSFM